MADHSPQWTIHPIEYFNEIADQWQSLNKNTANTLLLDPRFINPLIKHFADEDMVIALAYQQQSLIAACILSKKGWGQWQTFQPSQAPLGMWLCQTAYFHNTSLHKQLAKALPGLVLTISITQQDPQILPRPSDNKHFSTLDYITTARMDIPEDFDSYWQSRSKNVRTSVGKAKRRLEKEGKSITFEAETAVEKIHGCVRDYGQLESEGWKNETGTAIHIDNDQGKFYTQMLEAFGPRQCQVWRYYFDSELVATDLCIDDGATIYILKTTYAESWQRYSPAFSLHVDGIEHCSKLELKSIEFYGPSMQWHKKLTDDERTMYHLTFFNLAIVKSIKQRMKK